jgi:transposase
MRAVKRGRPHSEDLRSRVIAAIETGASYRQAAALHGVSASVAAKWAHAFRQTGSVAARPMGGDRRSRLKGERDWISGRIADEPGLTLAELHAELRDRGIQVSYLTLQRFLRKEHIEVRRAAACGTRPQADRSSGIARASKRAW